MSDTVISVEGLGKKYRITHQAERQRYTALRDVIAEKAKGFFKKMKSGNSENLKSGKNVCVSGSADVSVSAFQHVSISSSGDFWALKDVSFEVRRGEVVGIIGRNGAGKSTLLKILSRITEPTTGRVEITGRVASLLEVGTGFHPELTGRENIFLNGAILGMHRAEIKKKFDEIVAFAEVENFLDTPVKRYSSGMYVRLAFAVAANLEPEILIVDEVLAVGDAQFQKKCLGKMQDVARQEGRTVLFVSHNMNAVRSLCTSAMLLRQGRAQMRGAVGGVLMKYLDADDDVPAEAVWKDLTKSPGDEVMRLRAVRVTCGGRPVARVDLSREIDVEIEYTVLKPHNNICVSVHFHYAGSCAFVGGNESAAHTQGNYTARCRVPGHLLNNGRYSITVFLITDTMVYRCVEREVISFDVDEMESARGEYLGEVIGFVRPKLEWQTEPGKNLL